MVLQTIRRNCSVLFLAGVCASLSFAQTATLQLSPDAKDLLLELPSAIDSEVSTLAVELDGYDVTSFAVLNNTALELHLDTPLSAGEHELQVVLFHDNGDIDTLLEQPISVAEGETNNWQVNTTFNGNYRVKNDDDTDYSEVDHWSGTGGINIKGTEAIGKWQINTQLEAIYDSSTISYSDAQAVSDIDRFAGDEWFLPLYKLEANFQGDALIAGAAVGNIYIDREDLLFSAFQNRGVSGRIEGVNNNYNLEVFGVRSNPSTRYDGDLIMPENEDEKSKGFTASVMLIDQVLQLNTAYVDGNTSMSGAGFVGYQDYQFDEMGNLIIQDPIIYGGDSWNISLDAYGLNNSFWLHLEHAESDFDKDGIEQGIDAEKDNAMQAILRLSSDGDLNVDWMDYWNATLRYQEVGSDYYSVANIMIPGDLKMQSLAIQGGVSGLSFDVSWSEETNNIDDVDTLPTQTLERKGVSGSYSPMNIDPESGLWKYIGAPSVTASFYTTSHSQPDSDFNLSGFDLDNTNDETGLGLMFNRPTWNWGVQQQWIEQRDHTEAIFAFGYQIYQPPSDTDNDLLSFQAGWIPNEYISLNAMLQLSKQTELDSGTNYKNKNYGVDMLMHLIPEKLTWMINYNEGKDTSHFVGEGYTDDKFKTEFINTQLTWNLFKVKAYTPGLSTYLRGSYGKQNNYSYQQFDKQWTVLLGVELQWGLGGYGE